MSDKTSETNDIHDRLIDRALHEVLGGESPPDLTERILEAASSPVQELATPKTEDLAMHSAPFRSEHTWLTAAIAASIVVVLGSLFYLGSLEQQTVARKETHRASHQDSSVSLNAKSDFAAELKSIDISDIPVPDAPPMVYPDPEWWEEMTARRKKYKHVDLSGDGLTAEPPENGKGVPVLSNIPSIDRLYKNIEVSGETDSLMMGVKPHIIIEEEEEEYRGISVDIAEAPSTKAPANATALAPGKGTALNRERQKVAQVLSAKIEQYHTLAGTIRDGAEAPAEKALQNKVLRELQSIDQRRAKAEEELKNIEADYRLAGQKALRDATFEQAVQDELSSDPRMRKYKEEYFSIEGQILAQKPNSRGTSDAIHRLKSQLVSLNEQMKQYENQKSTELRERFSCMPNEELRVALTEYVVRRELLGQKLAALKSEKSEKVSELERFGEETKRLTLLLSEIDELKEIERDLDSRLLTAKVEQGTGPGTSGDQYTRIYENPFVVAEGEKALSTFSIDVDTASYANVRQFLMQSRQLPPPDAVRIEELINYFDYEYSSPTGGVPFASHVEVADCPWQPEHRLVRIGIKGHEIDRRERPLSNLVFLIDVSGSMNNPAKLPLLVSGMKLLTRELGENDRVAIVVYASSEGLALPSTRGDQQETILAALDKLRAGGSTAGGAGIQLAYKIAQENFIEGGVNRVILATDGDFNVGVTNEADLERMAETYAKESGVFLTVLGFGRGNLNDAMMEKISGKGNGNYHYIDNQTEAQKVLVAEMSGTLVTIAKDVKIQVEFNPAQVAGYRLLGYENRVMANEDFNDDKKDAGEIGAGHTVTALYEIVPAGKSVDVTGVDPLKYQQPAKAAGELASSDELLTLKIRYKEPDGDKSTKLEFPITDTGGSFAEASGDFKFAAAVASFGMLLRNSEHRGNASYAAVLEIAEEGSSRDPHGYRAEFLQMVRQAKALSGE
jgi:Ca-activated chloride channel family protein